MAIKSNDSNKEVAGGGIKLYSGLGNFKIIAVNPTLAELHENGIMLNLKIQLTTRIILLTSILFFVGCT